MVCTECVRRKGEQPCGELLIDTLNVDEQHAGVTLVCCFSRPVLVPYFFDAFSKLQMPRSEIHLLLYDNTDLPLLEQALLDAVRPLVSQFKSVRLYKSYLTGHGSISGSGNEIFANSVLFNIWDMWKRAKDMIYTPEFVQFEDDTIPPVNAFQALMNTLQDNENAGMVTAIATGRQPLPWVPVRLGVHFLKMEDQGGAYKFRILERHSCSPDLEGLQEVDGSGVYCFAARTEAYKTGFDGYDPNMHSVPFYGMDNVFTWNIKNHGYQIIADFSLWCEHLHVSPARMIAFSKNQAVEMVDVWLPQYNSYAEGIEVKAPGAAPRAYRVKEHARTWEIGDDAPIEEQPPTS